MSSDIQNMKLGNAPEQFLVGRLREVGLSSDEEITNTLLRWLSAGMKKKPSDLKDGDLDRERVEEVRRKI